MGAKVEDAHHEIFKKKISSGLRKQSHGPLTSEFSVKLSGLIDFIDNSTTEENL